MYLSERERDRRYGLVRRAMNETGVDALLVVGNNHSSGSPLFSTGSFRYLTDFFIFSLYGLLLFFRQDEPVMKMSEVIIPMAKTAKAHGFGLTTPMGHFVGLDLIEARVDADSQVILEPGIAMILHPRLDDFKGRRIILWGETYLMSEKGPIRLTRTDDTLHTV
jgi:hypothetical protein